MKTKEQQAMLVLDLFVRGLEVEAGSNEHTVYVLLVRGQKLKLLPLFCPRGRCDVANPLL